MEQNVLAEETGKMSLHNSMEEIVFEKTKSIISKMNMCQCEKCFWDVCSLVLNQLPPKYVTSTKGKLMAKLPSMSHKKDADLTILITQCAKMVQEKPMH
ncbi:MAG: late competence development ComFB family protein [Clostridiales bacterium]|nr:late competence development ComFB family protein [Clostridiales bacterium]